MEALIYKSIASEIYELLWETQDVEAIKKKLAEIVDEEYQNYIEQLKPSNHE